MPSPTPSDFTNNVTRFLDSRRVAHDVQTYVYSEENHSAVDVARLIGKPPIEVYKTLVVLPPDRVQQKPCLVVIPGPETLNLKKLAKAVGVKKMQMARDARRRRR